MNASNAPTSAPKVSAVIRKWRSLPKTDKQGRKIICWINKMDQAFRDLGPNGPSEHVPIATGRMAARINGDGLRG
jgi:hypothetical protein